MTETEPPASEITGEPEAEQPAEAAARVGPETAPLNRTWLIKMLAFLIILGVVGSWGLYDAMVAYPARGEKHASWAQWQYLLAARQANDREESGIFLRETSVPDPQAALTTLNDPENPDTQHRRDDMVNPQSTRHFRATMDHARLVWLNSLGVIGRMTPEHTTIADPTATLAELETHWLTQPQPKPLAGYDLPSQWAIVVVCWGIGGYLVFLFLKVATMKYRWDPASQTLTIPGGVTLCAADLDDIDKRKWDKFIVFITTKDGHALAGQEIRFDTFRHARLEDWILEMETAAFGSDEDDEESAGTESEEAGNADAGE